MTSLTMALAKGHDLSPEDYEVFKEKTKKMAVQVKNIIKVSDTDTCPCDTN